jgi:adenylate kinase family enzyme
MYLKKIHIIGSTGSGKSYLGRALSKQLGYKHYELDNIKYTKNAVTGKIVSKEERTDILKEVVGQPEWIIEGVHHSWIRDSLEEADQIIFLTPNVWIRDIRIMKRFIKTRLHLEESNWKQTLKDVWTLIDGNHKFEKERKPKIIELLKRYQTKTIILRDNKRIIKNIAEV